MKKIAFFILILFTAVQTVPAIQSFCNESKALIFNVDEEKNTDKTCADETKEKKEFPGNHFLSIVLSLKLNTAFHLAENILAPPCLEKNTPPPNFC
jgi:hypothetical protein